jgi:hypothetical protein
MTVLNLLRKAIIDNSPIKLLDTEDKETTDALQVKSVDINGQKFPATEVTNYKDPTSKEFLTLFEVYYGFLRRDDSHVEYIKVCRDAKFKAVSLVHKRDLFDYLSGAAASSAHIISGDAKDGSQTAKAANEDKADAATAKRSAEGLSKADNMKKLREDPAVLTQYKTFQNRDTIIIANKQGKVMLLSGISFNFSRLRMYVNLLLKPCDRKTLHLLLQRMVAVAGSGRKKRLLTLQLVWRKYQNHRATQDELNRHEEAIQLLLFLQF